MVCVCVVAYVHVTYTTIFGADKCSEMLHACTHTNRHTHDIQVSFPKDHTHTCAIHRRTRSRIFDVYDDIVSNLNHSMFCQRLRAFHNRMFSQILSPKNQCSVNYATLPTKPSVIRVACLRTATGLALIPIDAQRLPNRAGGHVILVTPTHGLKSIGLDIGLHILKPSITTA